MSDMIRSFVAFDIDNKLVLRRFSEAQNMLVATGANLKLVKPQNIHITMRFLGNISPSVVDLVYEEMRKISYAPFEVEIRGLGVFPSYNYTRVIWAGVQEGVDNLRDIFNQLDLPLRMLGFKSVPKGFNPHLTLARVKTGQHKSELIKCIKNCTDYEFGTIKANYLRLKKSVLTPRGPIYSTMYEVTG
jgi:2'-5' RNA ligase